MNFGYLLETAMLVCFGFSWPLNVVKAYRARTAKGTSLAFILLIITGYVAGIAAKIINGQFNYVLIVYFLNLAIVMTNVFVYFRNVSLDKQAAKKELKVTNKDIKSLVEAQEENMTNYTMSLDEVINRKPAFVEKKNSVILFGGSFDKNIPVQELSNEFSFNFDCYNKSAAGLSVSNACKEFENNIAQLKPEGIMIHLGETDTTLFQNDSAVFDNNYLKLISLVKETNKNCRISLISVKNPSADKNVMLMNAHIKAIAESEHCDFVNLENVKNWNPEATKAASAFARNMGLNVRKPLNDVAEIFYSYAYLKAGENSTQESLVG